MDNKLNFEDKKASLKISVQDFYNLYGCYLSKYKESSILGITVDRGEYIILLDGGDEFIRLPIPVHKEDFDNKFTDYANGRFSK